MNILTQKTALALGSNIGNAAEIFVAACKLLQSNGFNIISMAPLITTAPVDCPPGTPDFANSALTGTFAGTAEELLNLTQSIEVQLGRPQQHGFHESRTLDLDIILFDQQIIRTPRLTVPHPAARQRAFVLEPLAQIAPDWLFPDTGQSVSEAWQKLQTAPRS